MNELALGYVIKNKNEIWSGDLFSIFVRLRKYPMGYSYMPIVERRQKLTNNYFLNIKIPTTLEFGYQTEDQEKLIQVGGYFEGRDYPFAEKNNSGWLLTRRDKVLLSMQTIMFAPIYLRLDMGVIRQHFDIWNLTKEHQLYQSKFGPVIRLSVKTFFETED